jgi:hypothetical protein
MTNPLKALLAGIGGTLLFGFLTIYLFFFAGNSLKPSDIEIIRGSVARTAVLHAAHGSDSLQLWLTDQTIPFRGNAGYPDFYRKDGLSSLTPAASVEVGVRPSERLAPPRDRIHSQNFIPIYSVTVGKTQIFTLDDYNRWNVENQKFGRYLAPTLLACSLLSLGYGWRRLRRSSPDAT